MMLFLKCPIKRTCIVSSIGVAMVLVTACEDAGDRFDKEQAEYREKLETEALSEKLNQPVMYNPESCKRDAEGMVYFAVGRDVFRVPYEQKLQIRGMSEEERAKLPPRPDPTEPEGCPDNPMWGRGFSFTYKHQPEHPENYSEEVGFTAESISVTERFGTSNAMQLSGEENFLSKKLNHNECRLLTYGLEECLTPPSNKSIPKIDWGASYKAVPEVYDAPFDRSFIVSCRPSMVEGNQRCNVAYDFTRHSKIDYVFFRLKLPLEEIFAFDSGLRAAVRSAMVENYEWPIIINSNDGVE